MQGERLNNRQSGFGLLETLIGLMVFVLLVFVGTKAFSNVVSNHKKAAQLKVLTDAVATTAEKLAQMSVDALTDPVAGYTQWSKPQDAGLGDYVYQYRIVAKPNISGSADSNVVGLEVQAGTMVQGQFKMERNFATLIAPHLTSKDGLGKSSTQAERESEATFYASLKQRLADVAKQVPAENQKLLNSYSCYNPDECCGFMKDYFMNPAINPSDGLKEKCLYRCALSGNVRISTWQSSCNENFCASAPWKTSADCCAAIAAGQCPNGSVCASVCYDCVHEDGSSCQAPACTSDELFVNLFNCQTNTYCDGTPLPDGDIPGYGNVKNLCQLEECKNKQNECGAETIYNCCDSYWETLAQGNTPLEKYKTCATITKQSDCCDYKNKRGGFDMVCNNDGSVAASIYKGIAYCGSSPFTKEQDSYCVVYKGCPGTYLGSRVPYTGGCIAFTGPPIDNAWQNPFPSPNQSNNNSSSSGNKSNSNSNTSSSGKSPNQPPILKPPSSIIRVPSNRGGSPIFGGGGRE